MKITIRAFKYRLFLFFYKILIRHRDSCFHERKALVRDYTNQGDG